MKYKTEKHITLLFLRILRTDCFKVDVGLILYIITSRIEETEKACSWACLSKNGQVGEFAKFMMHSSWYKMWDRQTFLSFWAIFCPFTPLTTCKTNILKNEKMKKAPGDIIFLHLGNTNDNYMMYASCDMERDRIFCHFRPFLPCYPQQPKKSKFWKNGNKNLVILSFYISVLKIMIICSTIPDIWHVINFYFSFFLGFFFLAYYT